SFDGERYKQQATFNPDVYFSKLAYRRTFVKIIFQFGFKNEIVCFKISILPHIVKRCPRRIGLKWYIKGFQLFDGQTHDTVLPDGFFLFKIDRHVRLLNEWKPSVGADVQV